MKGTHHRLKWVTDQMGHTRDERQKGFTLLEVIFAISLLTIGILAIASMQASAIRNNGFSSGVTESANWCGAQLEQLLGLDWDDPFVQDADGDGSGGLDDIGFDNNPATQGDADFWATRGSYNIYWNVAESEITANTKTITVVVTWRDHGVLKRVTMRRILPRII